MPRNKKEIKETCIGEIVSWEAFLVLLGIRSITYGYNLCDQLQTAKKKTCDCFFFMMYSKSFIINKNIIFL